MTTKKTAKPEDVAVLDDLDSTLAARGANYGKFENHAAITQQLKDVMRATPKWDKLTPPQKEALEMVAHKVGRILNGNPNFADSWHDIAGYASLVDKILCGGGI